MQKLLVNLGVPRELLLIIVAQTRSQRCYLVREIEETKFGSFFKSISKHLDVLTVRKCILTGFSNLTIVEERLR